MKKSIYDVLIIGSGGAGLFASILATNQGLNSAVISKVHPLKSHTIAAQGGINASFGHISADDWKWHMYDTIKAGAGLSDHDSVEFMCKEAPSLVNMLADLGVEFDRMPDGRIDQRVYGGQTIDYGKGELAQRACFSKDKTGHNIMHILYKKAKENNVTFFNNFFALDLVIENQKCKGVFCWDIAQGKMRLLLGKNVIIATGGYSQIYATATSAALCTGDGNGLAHRAQIPLQDMEFIQFHPTAISKIGVLITEASRSAGGRLLNNLGEAFMSKYDAKLKDLATRDIVARAISTEIIEGRGCGANKDHIFLDLTHLSQKYIRNNLPTVFENCRNFLGIDPSKELIPIAPAAHYTMGGIGTNNNCQALISAENSEQYVENLYVIGEAASTSVHGAGRLGCNSLLDLIAFAKKSVTHIVTNCDMTAELADHSNVNIDSLKSRWAEIFQRPAIDIIALITKLKNIMSANVGIFRSKEKLLEAIAKIEEINKKYQQSGVSEQSLKWNIDFQHYIELGNMLVAAKATTHAALWRQESRGAHWRVDFPQSSEEFCAHSIYVDQQPVKTRSVRTKM